MRRLPLTHYTRFMAVGAAFVFSLAAVTASHAQSVFEDWESPDVPQEGSEEDVWPAEWDFYHAGGLNNRIRILDRTADGRTQMGFISNPDSAPSGLYETWASYGDTVFTDVDITSNVGVHEDAFMRVGLVARFAADENDNLTYYMARRRKDAFGEPSALDLIRMEANGSETELASMAITGEGELWPTSFMSFSVTNVGDEAHLEVTYVSHENDSFTLNAVDSDPLVEGLVGVYGRTTSNNARSASFDNFQAVPEPASIGLMFGGLALMMTLRRRRNVA